MKGILFTSFLKYVEEKDGLMVLDELLETTETKTDGIYNSIGRYDFMEFVNLIGNYCSLTSSKPKDILFEIGKLVTHNYMEDKMHLLDKYKTLFNALEYLDTIFLTEVSKLYDNKEIPRFNLESKTEDKLVIDYSSYNPFPEIIKGIIQTISEYYKEQIEINYELIQSDIYPHIIRFAIEKR